MMESDKPDPDAEKPQNRGTAANRQASSRSDYRYQFSAFTIAACPWNQMDRKTAERYNVVEKRNGPAIAQQLHRIGIPKVSAACVG
jgi:hypothetical protein